MSNSEQILVVKKGYTITVDSWENDGDLNSTLFITVDTYELAEAYFKLLQLCTGNHMENDFGNAQRLIEEDIEFICNFLKENKVLLYKYKKNLNNAEQLLDYFHNLLYPLIGYSEDYVCRVADKIVITYSPEDIYCSVVLKN